MNAYKWLSPGAVGLFSDFSWPPPGEWVDTGTDLVDCLRGVHALRFEDLLDWIDDELWEIELEGTITERDGMLVATRGRLVRRIDGWNAASAGTFADACAARAAAFAADALRRAGLTREAERVEQAEGLPAVQEAAIAAIAATGDAGVSEVAAFAADMVSLVGGGRPDAWGSPVLMVPVEQSPGAVAANAGLVSAHAAGRAAVAAAADESAYDAGFASERAWQLAWVGQTLRIA